MGCGCTVFNEDNINPKIKDKYIEIIDKNWEKMINDAYVPIVKRIKKITKETGLEEKFGGKLPFMMEDEKWPTNDINEPMSFIFQLKDPRQQLNNDLILYRFFMKSENNEKFYAAIDKSNIKLLPIELSEKNIKKQNKDIINSSDFILKPYEIVSWQKKMELACVNEFYNFVKNEVKNKDNFIYIFYNHLNYNGQIDTIKIGGTPRTRQLYNLYKLFNFIQLSKTYYLPITWGDNGIGHINKLGNYYWDCY